MAEHPHRTLAHSGHHAVITPDRWVPGAYTLTVDGTPQSHVDLEDPTHLFFEYVHLIWNSITFNRYSMFCCNRVIRIQLIRYHW